MAAENMWRFVQLLADSAILPGLIPEVAALASLRQNSGKLVDEEQSVFQHTIDCMRYYPEEKLHHDWIGVVGVLFRTSANCTRRNATARAGRFSSIIE